MKHFLTGLAAVFVGFTIWITVSVIYGVAEGLEAGSDFKPPAAFYWFAIPAVLLMIGGPFWFWLIAPLWSWLSRPTTAQETPVFFELGWGVLKGLMFLGIMGLIIAAAAFLVGCDSEPSPQQLDEAYSVGYDLGVADECGGERHEPMPSAYDDSLDEGYLADAFQQGYWAGRDEARCK